MIETYLINRVKAYGGITRKVSWIGRAGTPDRLVMLHGRHCFVELKCATGRLSAAQKREHELMKEKGNIVVEVVWSKEDVEDLIDRMTQPHEWEIFREYCS